MIARARLLGVWMQLPAPVVKWLWSRWRAVPCSYSNIPGVILSDRSYRLGRRAPISRDSQS